MRGGKGIREERVGEGRGEEQESNHASFVSFCSMVQQ